MNENVSWYFRMRGWLTAAHFWSLCHRHLEELSPIGWHAALFLPHTDPISLNITVRHFITDLISCLVPLAVRAAMRVGGNVQSFSVVFITTMEEQRCHISLKNSLIMPLCLILPSLQDNNCCILQWSFPEFQSHIRKQTSVMSVMISHLYLCWFL